MMEKDSEDDLRRFAEALIEKVRDRAIIACDHLASGEMVGPDGIRWRTVVPDDEMRRAVHELIPDIVDQVLFELLNATDNDELPLGWRRQDGSLIGLEELGSAEMAGWLMGSPGWRHQYSQQRFFDPLSDLRLDLESKPPEDE
jgi:hypothetical protein